MVMSYKQDSVLGKPVRSYYADAMAAAGRRRIEKERRLREENEAAVKAGTTTSQDKTPFINQGAYGQTTDAVESTSEKPVRDYYAEAMAAAERRRREEERRLREANRAAVNAGITTLQGQIPFINQGAYGQTTDAYVRNEQAKAAMPQQMAAMGNTGGMSESSMLGVNANYQNMVNSIIQEKQNALNGIQGDIARLQSEGDMNLANQLSQTSDKYYEQMIRNQMAQAAAQEKQLENEAQRNAKTKPELSAALALELYASGNRSPGVMKAMKHYELSGSAEFSGSKQVSPEAEKYIDGMGWDHMDLEQRDQSIASTLERMLQNGVPESVLNEIAANYGIALTFS